MIDNPLLADKTAYRQRYRDYLTPYFEMEYILYRSTGLSILSGTLQICCQTHLLFD